jgi:hypothetical protein
MRRFRRNGLRDEIIGAQVQGPRIISSSRSSEVSMMIGTPIANPAAAGV